MIKVDLDMLKKLEDRYLRILQQIEHFENKDLPCCTHCGSDATSVVQVGVVGG